MINFELISNFLANISNFSFGSIPVDNIQIKGLFGFESKYIYSRS